MRKCGWSVTFGGVRYWGPEGVGGLSPPLEMETPIGVSPLGGGSPLEARLGREQGVGLRVIQQQNSSWVVSQFPLAG